ncbi:MAG: hypothetical protein R3F34_10545 [Planctomycetota bacterium]
MRSSAPLALAAAVVLGVLVVLFVARPPERGVRVVHASAAEFPSLAGAPEASLESVSPVDASPATSSRRGAEVASPEAPNVVPLWAFEPRSYDRPFDVWQLGEHYDPDQFRPLDPQQLEAIGGVPATEAELRALLGRGIGASPGRVGGFVRDTFLACPDVDTEFPPEKYDASVRDEARRLLARFRDEVAECSYAVENLASGDYAKFCESDAVVVFQWGDPVPPVREFDRRGFAQYLRVGERWFVDLSYDGAGYFPLTENLRQGRELREALDLRLSALKSRRK